MILLFFLYGLIVGSFLNVLIYRLPRSLAWINSRSFCPNCKHKITWHDNIPLLSWAILRGRCRHCRKPISWQYPAVELANGLLWAALATSEVKFYLHLGNSPTLSLIFSLTLLSVLLVIFVIDLQHYIIPDQAVVVIIAIALLIGLIWGIGGDWSDMFARIIWGLGLGLFFYLLHMVTKGRGMGFGDVKLAFAIGLLLRQSALVAIFAAFVMGAFIGIILLTTKLREFKQPIPFGPFLVIGTITGLLWGEKILQWYLSSFMLY